MPNLKKELLSKYGMCVTMIHVQCELLFPFGCCLLNVNSSSKELKTAVINLFLKILYLGMRNCPVLVITKLILFLVSCGNVYY